MKSHATKKQATANGPTNMILKFLGIRKHLTVPLNDDHDEDRLTVYVSSSASMGSPAP